MTQRLIMDPGARIEPLPLAGDRRCSVCAWLGRDQPAVRLVRVHGVVRFVEPSVHDVSFANTGAFLCETHAAAVDEHEPDPRSTPTPSRSERL